MLVLVTTGRNFSSVLVSLIRPLVKSIYIIDADELTMKTLRVMNFTVQLGNFLDVVPFKVVKKLSTDVILGVVQWIIT